MLHTLRTSLAGEEGPAIFFRTDSIIISEIKIGEEVSGVIYKEDSKGCSERPTQTVYGSLATSDHFWEMTHIVPRIYEQKLHLILPLMADKINASLHCPNIPFPF
jgi:hypothetical protein